MSAFTSEQLDLIAHMARLALKEEEKALYSKQLDGILTAIAKLNEVDTTQVEPTYYLVAQRNVMRADVCQPGLAVEQVMANAPAEQDGFFRVPRIMEE